MDNKNLTIVAISALASLLATCTFISSEIAFACGHHHSKFIRQTAVQANVCGNGIMSSDINCQNLGNQVKGDHNASTITGIRPSSYGGFDHGNDGHNGHNDQVSSPSSSSPSSTSPSSSSTSPSGYIPSGNPITGADP